MALLEAIAAGVPVVATAVDGIAEVLAPDAALLAEPGDVEGLVLAVGAALGDHALRQRLTTSAKASVGTWTTRQMSDEYLRAYGDGGGVDGG